MRKETRSEIRDQIIFIICFIVAWQIVYNMRLFSPTAFPSVGSIGQSFFTAFTVNDMLSYTGHSLLLIAKGLALNPKIILMDEPFAALDAMTRNKLQAELIKIKEKENATVIFITHNIQEALVLGNRVILMSKDGVIKINTENNIPKPVTPASEGYGEMWKTLNDALWEEDEEGGAVSE